MHAIVFCSCAGSIAAQRGDADKRAATDSLDTWLNRLARLDEDDLEKLTPVVLADSATDALRKLIGFCTFLSQPAQALNNWLSKPCDELIRQLFQLHMVATYLMARERGESPPVTTLEQWCGRTIAESIQDDESANRAAQWCSITNVAHATPHTRIPATSTERQACNASTTAAPNEIAGEKASGIEQEALVTSTEVPANGATHGVMY